MSAAFKRGWRLNAILLLVCPIVHGAIWVRMPQRQGRVEVGKPLVIGSGGEFRGEIRLTVRRTPISNGRQRETDLRVYYKELSAPLIGELQVRPDGQSEFVKVMDIVQEATALSEHADVTGIEGIAEVAWLDIRVVSPAVKDSGTRDGREIIAWQQQFTKPDIGAVEADALVMTFARNLRETGQPYRLTFADAFSRLPPNLERALRDRVCHRRFFVATVRESLGLHVEDIGVLIVLDTCRNQISGYILPLWVDEQSVRLSEAFRGIACTSVAQAEETIRRLAELVAYITNGAVGKLTTNETDSSVSADIFWLHWSVDKPYRRLLFYLDSEMRISEVRVRRPE